MGAYIATTGVATYDAPPAFPVDMRYVTRYSQL